MTGTVKALEWKSDAPEYESWSADTPFGRYVIVLWSTGEWNWCLSAGVGHNGKMGALDEMRAAAQADYERRILSALTASASEPEPVARKDLSYGQKLIAEAIEAHFGEREELDDASGDTTNRDVWEAFDALANPVPTPDGAVEALLRELLELATSGEPKITWNSADPKERQAHLARYGSWTEDRLIAIRNKLELSLSAALSHPADGWRDIESAPKDGEPVDLWCFWPESKKHRRSPDCRWNGDEWVFGTFTQMQFMYPPVPLYWMRPAAPAAKPEGE